MSGWTDKRPMSPHLQVWRWHGTMLGSILHRASGIANYAGAMLAVGWLFAAASGPEAYDALAGLVGTIPGLLVMFGFTVSVCYHLLNGVRHLFLDSGKGFSVKAAGVSAFLVLVGSVVLAAVVWVVGGLVPGVSLGGGY